MKNVNNLLSPKKETVFEAIFAQNTEESNTILMDFLNSIPETKVKIKSIVNVKTFIGSEYKTNEVTIHDVNVITENNEDVLINVLNWKNRSSLDLISHYHFKAISESVEDPDTENIPKVISINLLDFNVLDSNHYHGVMMFRNQDDTHQFDDFQAHLIELQKIPVDNISEMNTMELWLHFISKCNNEEVLNELSKSNELIKMACNILKRISYENKVS